jgi:hypothetical protein
VATGVKKNVTKTTKTKNIRGFCHLVSCVIAVWKPSVWGKRNSKAAFALVVAVTVVAVGDAHITCIRDTSLIAALSRSPI